MVIGPVFEPREAHSSHAPGDDQPQDMLGVVVGIDQAITRLIAARTRALDLARRGAELREPAGPARIRSIGGGALGERSFRAEVAAALNVSERAAENLIANAQILSSDLPATLDALGEGTISYRHATIMVEQAVGLDAEGQRGLEQAVLAKGSSFTAPKFARAVRIARERANPESIAVRHEKAREERGISIDDRADGLSTLFITLPSPAAHAVFNRLNKAAHVLRRPDDGRTQDQRRADLFVAVMLSESGGLPFGVVPNEVDSDEFISWFRGIKAQVVVSVPVLTLLDRPGQRGIEPGMLEGRIPIDPETARRLAARATSFIRILTHPETGATLSVGRRRYKVPKDLKTYLRIRDVTCRFPGCSMAAARCDLDHNLDWQFGGETSHANLAHFCRGHHMVKGATDWSVTQSSENPGVLTWRSPSGRRYVNYPENPIAG